MLADSKANETRPKEILKMHKLLATIALLSFTTAVNAGTGSQGYFEIYNNTANNIVSGFFTNDGSGWSSNWLEYQIPPGESQTAQFSAVNGACDQEFQVGWLGNNGEQVFDEPISIDICDASNVYLDDNEIYFD
jgi:hypothetical protein